MYHVIYNEDGGGTLECARCGKAYEFALGDAKNAIYCHFNPDTNADIDECPEVRWTPGEVPWEAVDSEGNVKARGRVVVVLIGNAIQSPDIIQDWPSR